VIVLGKEVITMKERQPKVTLLSMDQFVEKGHEAGYIWYLEEVAGLFNNIGIPVIEEDGKLFFDYETLKEHPDMEGKDAKVIIDVCHKIMEISE
jgi:hypothetical protein